MNPWLDVVDSLRLRAERFDALRLLTDGRVGARANRGRRLPGERLDALIWGLRHPSPVVRRCCLELLDQHPDARAVPHIVACLDDAVPRVRWHAVHALICDACKPGSSYLSDDILARIREMAGGDESEKVRAQAQWGIDQAKACRT
jgi:HEAT repeat protein